MLMLLLQIASPQPALRLEPPTPRASAETLARTPKCFPLPTVTAVVGRILRGPRDRDADAAADALRRAAAAYPQTLCANPKG